MTASVRTRTSAATADQEHSEASARGVIRVEPSGARHAAA